MITGSIRVGCGYGVLQAGICTVALSRYVKLVALVHTRFKEVMDKEIFKNQAQL